MLEESLTGSPLVQIVWHKLQYLDILGTLLEEFSGGIGPLLSVTAILAASRSETNLKRTAVEDARAGWKTRKKSKPRVSPRNVESWWTWRGMVAVEVRRA